MLPYLLAVSCTDKVPDETASPQDSQTVVVPEGPCVDGARGDGWGLISSDPLVAIHVRTDGDDGGDGGHARPVATLQKALELAVLEQRPIAVGPGEFTSSLSLFGAPSGIVIQGCSPQETVLIAESDALPVIDTNGATDVVLGGFATLGGEMAIKVWAGSTVDISDLLIDGSKGAGISMNGGYSVLSRVEVTNPVASDQGYAYGIAMDGGEALLAQVSVRDATMAGILVGGGTVELIGVSVPLRVAKITRVNAGDMSLLGRGIQLQEYANGVFADVTLSDNADAGLYALRSAVTSTNLTIEGTTAGVCEGCELQTGDAAVFSRGDSNVAPSTFQIALTDSVIDGADRTGFLFSGVTANVTGTLAQDCGHLVDEKALLFQDGAVVSGDEVAVLDSPLGTNLNLLPQPE